MQFFSGECVRRVSADAASPVAALRSSSTIRAQPIKEFPALADKTIGGGHTVAAMRGRRSMVSIKQYLNGTYLNGTGTETTLRQALALLVEKIGDCAVE